MNLTELTILELLALHSKLSKELRARSVIRTANNLTGDLAERLFCEAFKWEATANSHAHIDAIDPSDKTRYQIKGRRLDRVNSSRQLSAIRDLKSAHFDYLAGVLFNEDYSIKRAALIPYDIVLCRASRDERTNSYRFHLRDEVWNLQNVRDVTLRLRSVKI